MSKYTISEDGISDRNPSGTVAVRFFDTNGLTCEKLFPSRAAAEDWIAYMASVSTE